MNIPLKNTLPFKSMLLSGAFLASTFLTACAPQAQAPSFQAALDNHLAMIADRNLEGYTATINKGDALPLVFPDGSYLNTTADVIAMHTEWFKDKDWRMTFEPVSQVIGSDLAVALVKTSYRDTEGGAPRFAYLALTFQLQDGEWRLVLDQNTRIIQQTAN